jgi:hypothetical protein
MRQFFIEVYGVGDELLKLGLFRHSPRGMTMFLADTARYHRRARCEDEIVVWLTRPYDVPLLEDLFEVLGDLESCKSSAQYKHTVSSNGIQHQAQSSSFAMRSRVSLSPQPGK